MARVLVPLAKGFEDIEAVTVVDVLRRGGVEVVTASISDSVEVESAHGIAVKADALFRDVSGGEYDAIVLPGGGEGTENLRHCEPLIVRLRRQNEERRLICAICAAPVVLVEAGVAEEGRHMTCYPSMMLELDRSYVNVPVVADGNLITGQAPGSAMLFALVILQTLVGEAKTRKISRGMVTDVLD
ncbi:MAG: DJ-1/PfpI family protein [Kiritimatiellae bacterium]|nr:DJ-1/PfpI family protein [Kiritimatiellia bacterium]